MIHDQIFDFLERQAICLNLPKDKLTVECALALAEVWCEELEDEDSCRIQEPEGWRKICKVLADEVRRLQWVVSQSSIVEADYEQMLEFDLPENETEARAALNGLDHIVAIHRFRERLRNIVKYDDPISVEAVYREYCEMMEGFLE